MTDEEYRDLFRHDIRILQLLSDMGYKPEVIWDVGASNGSWSILCAEIFPDARYDLFEPLAHVNPDYKQQWAGDWMANTFMAKPNRHLHAFALGKQSGPTDMSVFPNGVSSSLLPLQYGESYGVSKVEVEVMTGKEVTDKMNLPAPSILKMDVQGYEMDVLLGSIGLLDRIDVILAECWLLRSYEYMTPLFSEVTRMLSFHGFEIFDFGTEYRPTEGDHANRLVSVDAWFVKKSHPVFKADFQDHRGNEYSRNI
jgi:FkbM family methyltransferase